MPPDDAPQPDTPLNEFSAAAAISALSKPQAPPKGPDGRFQSTRPQAEQPPREPETQDSEPIDDPDAAPDGALGDDDIEIDDGAEVEPTQASSLDMPDSWGKTAEALWQGLSPEQQQFIKQHESKRTSGLSRQANELKAEQDRVKAEAARVEQERLQLAQAAQRYQSDAVKRFQAEFGDVKDVQKLASEDPARFLKWQAAYMGAQAAVQEAGQWQKAIDEDRIKQLTEFRQAENAKLAERFGLDDEAKALAFQDRIVKFVEPLGITQQRLAQYTAEEIALAEDGRKWRAAMAKRAEVERQKAPPPKVVRPGTPQTGSNLREQSVTQLSQKLAKTGKDSDAAALIKARWNVRR